MGTKKYCIDCNSELTQENWTESLRKTRNYFCKKCRNIRDKIRNSKEPNKRRIYQSAWIRNWRKENPLLAREKDCRYRMNMSVDSIKRVREYNREYSKKVNKHSIKYKSRMILNRAIITGKIVRPESCVDCGTIGKVQGHHSDYSKPLKVEWLCSKCHALKHHPITTC